MMGVTTRTVTTSRPLRRSEIIHAIGPKRISRISTATSSDGSGGVEIGLRSALGSTTGRPGSNGIEGIDGIESGASKEELNADDATVRAAMVTGAAANAGAGTRAALCTTRSISSAMAANRDRKSVV